MKVYFLFFEEVSGKSSVGLVAKVDWALGEDNSRRLFLDKDRSILPVGR